MHSVELLEQALSAARSLGYEVRQEWLGGAHGGPCEFGGRRFLFVDLSLNTLERLEEVLEVLRDDPATHMTRLPHDLRRALGATTGSNQRGGLTTHLTRL